MNSNKAINLLDNPSPALRASSPTRGEGNGVQGFTLIELLVVVPIIGILAAVAVPQYQVTVAKSNLMKSLTLAKSIKDAEEVYYLAHGTYTINLADLDIAVGPYHTSYPSNKISKNTLADDTIVLLAIDGGGSIEDRVEVYTNSKRRQAIVFHFEHGQKSQYNAAGRRSCIGDKNTIYEKACIAMGGKYAFTIGDTTYQYYWLP